MLENLNPELGTKLVGASKLVVVNKHLSYRVDEVEFPGGVPGTYTYIDDDYAAATTVPLDRRNGQRSTLLVRQERYPSQTVGWEVPAGRPEPGETQLEAAQRELREEGNIEAQYWEQLPSQVDAVGRGNSRSDLFAAAGITAVQGFADNGEVITDRHWFTMSEAEDLILKGQINSAHTIACLAVANLFIERNPDHPISKLVT